MKLKQDYAETPLHSPAPQIMRRQNSMGKMFHRSYFFHMPVEAFNKPCAFPSIMQGLKKGCLIVKLVDFLRSGRYVGPLTHDEVTGCVSLAGS